MKISALETTADRPTHETMMAASTVSRKMMKKMGTEKRLRAMVGGRRRWTDRERA